MSKRRKRHLPPDPIRDAYSQEALKRILEMPERRFASEFEGFTKYVVNQPAPSNFFYHRDSGASILAVAHLDTVAPANARTARFIPTEAGPVVYSRGLDDRLGAYIILDMLPKLGVNVDVLLTVGEEDGESTAAFFEAGQQYNWMIEFDRGGTDVVLYEYEDFALRAKVHAAGARVGHGSFSDISYMEHVGIKGLNWGVGYRDYHGPKAHAYLDDTFMMVDQFLNFYDENRDIVMPHEIGKWSRGRYRADTAVNRPPTYAENVDNWTKRHDGTYARAGEEGAAPLVADPPREDAETKNYDEILDEWRRQQEAEAGDAPGTALVPFIAPAGSSDLGDNLDDDPLDDANYDWEGVRGWA